MAATRAGMRVAAISSDGPRWLDGLAGSGPPRGPKLLSAGWTAELNVHGLLGGAAPDLEREGLAGLHRLDDVAELRLARDGLAVGGDDDVAAEAVGLAGERDGGGAGAEPGERRRRCRA